MSLGRKLTADQPARNIGARSEPTGDAKGGDLVIKGDGIARVQRGHEDLGQVMRRGLELRGNGLTHRYVEGAPTIEPGEYAAYTVRAAGDISVSLAKPPAIPAAQEHPTDGARQRRWRVSLVVYHASVANVSWPSGVVWSRAGYELTGDPATLAELPGPPPNPRPAGTADAFQLEYDERTGQWLVTITHSAVAYADPQNTDPDATEPEPEEPPAEDGTDPDETPDHEYTDPETGDPVAPENPGDDGSPVPEGYAIAVHDGTFSVSRTSGSTWELFPDGVAGATDIAAMSGTGFYVVGSGGVFTSDVLGNFQPLALYSQAVVEVDIPNGDFESGDLAPWTLDAGTPPLVLDIDGFPPQRPGSEWFLATDIHAGTDPAFSVSQSVTFPASSNGAYDVEAWFFLANPSSGGTISLRSDETPKYFFDADGFQSKSTFNANLASDSIRDLRFDGDPADIAELTQIDDWTVEMFWRPGFSQDHKEIIDITISGWRRRIASPTPIPYPSSAIGAFQYLDTNGRLNQELPVVLTKSGRNPIILTLPAGWQMPYGRRSSRSDLFILNTTSGGLNGGEPYPVSLPSDFEPDNLIATASADPAIQDEWQRVFLSAPAGQAASVVLEASGNAHVDDVAIRSARFRDEAPLAVARNRAGRELWALTEESLWRERAADGQPVRIGPSPLPGAHMLDADQLSVAVSDGSQNAVSIDQGATWQATIAPTTVVQTLAPFGAAFLLADGRVLNGSGSVVATLESGVHLAADRRGRRWLIAYPDGRVKSAPTDWSALTDLASMPASATAPARRILPLPNGWTLAHAEDSRDWFWRPAPQHPDNMNPSWRLGKPLKNAISTLAELM